MARISVTSPIAQAPTVRSPDEGADAQDSLSPITDLIVRFRWWFFIGIALIYVAAFSGEWRIGRDSAIYRGLGHNLAIGKGYTFGSFSKQQIYPGLPVLLAGLEKIFPNNALPPLVLMHLMALGCVVISYRLIALRYPQWMAIAVACGVAINGWFLELSNEILTDVPFLLGVLLALYGWERLRTAEDRREKILAAIYLVAGLALAAATRPTFWILAIAWVAVCVWGLITGPRRFYAICLVVLIVVWSALLFLDPRVKGHNPLAGGYEQDALASVSQVGQSVLRTLPKLVSKDLSVAFFGLPWGFGLTEVLCIVLIGSSVLMFRRQPLWTILIVLTIGVTLLMGTVPRYYIMALPLMMLGWLLLGTEIAKRVPPQFGPAVLVIFLGAVIVPNLARCVKVIAEQHHLSKNYDEKWVYAVEMAKMIKERVPADGKVIAPAASIMRYISGREVFMQRDLKPKSSDRNYPQTLRELGITHVVFPSTLYKEGERTIRELIDKGVLIPNKKVGSVDGMTLNRVRILVSDGDWRHQAPKSPTEIKKIAIATTQRFVKKVPTTAQIHRQIRLAKEAKAVRLKALAARDRKVAMERKAAKIRKQKRELRAKKAAATQHSTALPARQVPINVNDPDRLSETEFSATLLARFGVTFHASAYRNSAPHRA